ncbi:hypothetical protein CDL15_Pgr025914 [Punica granatum]|uniref:Uncharacterized protein n=1 Tax=Punica granatum TaxID=22663 RepID=A0A218WB98_PUNGR|nr:hypothetical protein CDL15_Pgr025914 [Punica granatum]PKI72390.1 hypothetical protein CRG98_007260 [Punica granatum]
MRKFDPWPVFFKREWSRTWPFLVGFAVTGTLITKLSLSLTEEDAKNSPFVQRHKKQSQLYFFPFEILILDAFSGCPLNVRSFSIATSAPLEEEGIQ